MNPPDGITEAQVAEHERELRARAVAHATPLPGPLADAFAGRPPRVGPHQLRDVMLDDFCLLQELGSPLAELMSAPRPNVPDLTLAQLRELVFLWTRPLEEAEALLAQGPAAWQKAVARFRLGVRLADLPRIVEAVAANIARAFSTKITYGKEKTGNFSSPAGPNPTGSAGGSPSSGSSAVSSAGA